MDNSMDFERDFNSNLKLLPYKEEQLKFKNVKDIQIDEVSGNVHKGEAEEKKDDELEIQKLGVP